MGILCQHYWARGGVDTRGRSFGYNKKDFKLDQFQNKFNEVLKYDYLTIDKKSPYLNSYNIQVTELHDQASYWPF